MTMAAKSLAERLSDAGFAGRFAPKARTVGDHRITCPRCEGGREREKSLALTIDAEGGAVWICFRGKCGWTGNIPGRAGHPGPWREPVRRRPPPPAATPRPKALLDWFARRGIGAGTVEAMGIHMGRNWFPQTGREEDCVVFPYRVGGQVVNNKYRTFDKHFRQDKDAESVLYNIDAVVGMDRIIVVEGEMDVLSLLEVGYRHVVSLPNGAPATVGNHPDRSLKRLQPLVDAIADRLGEMGEWIIATDGDPPGNALAEEIVRRVGREKCRRVHWPAGTKDANEALVSQGREILVEVVEAAIPYPIHGLFTITPGALLAYRDLPGAGCVSTGWDTVDEIVKLPLDGRLFVITGIPNSGKSEWLDALMVNASMAHGWRWAVCSPENNPIEEHVAKLAEKYMGAPFRTFRDAIPRMSDEQVSAAERWVSRHFSFIRADANLAQVGRGEGGGAPVEPPLTSDFILSKATDAVRRFGIGGLVIDPWNELEQDRRGLQTETEFVSATLSKLRKFAQGTRCNVFLVAHPQKIRAAKVGDPVPVPGLYDISGSAHFANKADFGIAVHRPDPQKPLTEIHVLKVRFKGHGRKGKCELWWDKYTGRYAESPWADYDAC